MAKYMLLSDVEGNFNRQNTIPDAWSPNNTSSKIPRLSKADPNGNFTTPSDWYLEDASYLRIKNVRGSFQRRYNRNKKRKNMRWFNPFKAFFRRKIFKVHHKICWY